MKTKNAVICMAVTISILLCGCAAGSDATPEALTQAEKLIEQGMYKEAASAFAETVAQYQRSAQPIEASQSDDAVYVGGIRLASGQYLENGASAPSDIKPKNTGYVYLDNQTLTMHNAVVPSGTLRFDDIENVETLEAAIYSSHSLTIILEGKNFALGNYTAGEVSVGVVVYNYDYHESEEKLSISGSGSLSVTGGVARMASAGIACSGILEITGNAVINAIGASLPDSSEGASVGLFCDGDIIISKNSKITGVSGSIGENGYLSIGVLAEAGNVIIDNSTVIAVTLSQTGDTCACTEPQLTNVSVVEASMNSDGSNPVAYNVHDIFSYKYIKIA